MFVLIQLQPQWTCLILGYNIRYSYYVIDCFILHTADSLLTTLFTVYSFVNQLRIFLSMSRRNSLESVSSCFPDRAYSF